MSSWILSAAVALLKSSNPRSESTSEEASVIVRPRSKSLVSAVISTYSGMVLSSFTPRSVSFELSSLRASFSPGSATPITIFELASLTTLPFVTLIFVNLSDGRIIPDIMAKGTEIFSSLPFTFIFSFAVFV